MRLLFTLRVPKYNPDKETLTASGLETSRGMAANLGVLALGREVALLSSDAPRALACAAIIGETLGIKVQAYHELFSGENDPPDLNACMRLVEAFEGKVDMIILVVHCGLAEYFPAFFAKQRVGEGERDVVHDLYLDNGHARTFDCNTHELAHVRA